MTISEKLDLLMLGAEERKKAESKFLSTLALVDDIELRQVADFLRSEDVNITRARDIKVVGNSKDEIAKKFSILGEIHETDLYRKDPSKISYNVIDIYKKIQYCKQVGRAYKKADGTYEGFLFDETLWQQAMESVMTTPEPTIEIEKPGAELVTLEPEIVPEPTPIRDERFVDINDYMAANKEIENLEAQTTDFATIRKELEGQLAELDTMKSDLSYGEIKFDDLETESYGGRAA